VAALAIKPGSFRVSDKPAPDGMYRLTGVLPDGQRVRLKFLTLTEAHTRGRVIFEGAAPPQSSPVLQVEAPAQSSAAPALDDFGLPVDFHLPEVSAETVAAGAPPAEPPISIAPPSPLDSERTKNAKSLCELFGVAYAAGVVYSANSFLEPRYENVPKPSKKSVNDLADNFKKALVDLFGDREVGPWTMVVLLTLGIPIAMWIQSDKPKTKIPSESPPPLKSV